MKVLSLFDGMACGYLAMHRSGLSVSRYEAFEVDKYAIKTSSHNFPSIKHRGDVFEGNFEEFKGFDFLLGGSPCTYWSIAQKNNRETEASGMGWELFSQYVRALKEAQPKYFIYENNKSMSNAIRESITKTFGFEPICINSALVSAQNRQRLYWVGKRNEDGTYSKVEVERPIDRGIMLENILIGVARIPEYGNPSKARALGSSYANKGCGEGSLKTDAFPDNPNKQVFDYVTEPVRAGAMPKPIESKTLEKAIPDIVVKFGYLPKMFNAYNRAEIKDKAPTLSTGSMVTSSCAVNRLEEICCFAIPCEWDEDGKPTKAVSCADGKTYQVYEVKRGFITIKGKEYPVKLDDGFYIIRKLTVRECMRLQTVPEWYEFPVSDSQAYKMLGNGWTVDVISYLITEALANKPIKGQISIYDLI